MEVVDRAKYFENAKVEKQKNTKSMSMFVHLYVYAREKIRSWFFSLSPLSKCTLNVRIISMYTLFFFFFREREGREERERDRERRVFL